MIPELPRIKKSARWHDKRKKGIGGSDWASILSDQHPEEYKWACIRRLYYSKAGYTPDFLEKSSKGAMRGNILEPVVAELFKAQTGCRYTRKRPRAKELYHGQPVPARWRFNLDRLAEMPPDWHQEILEIKTMNRDVWFPFLENGLSVGYKLQPQHYMGITGLDVANVAVMWPDGLDFQIEVVTRDVEILRLMVEAGEWFWSIVEAKKTPDRPPVTEQRCAGCPFALQCLGKSYYEIHEMSLSDLSRDETLYDLLIELDALKASKKATEKEVERVQEKIQKYIVETHGDDVEQFFCREFEVTWKKGMSSRFQRKELLADRPDLAAAIREHTKFFPTRTFSAKVSKKALPGGSGWEGDDRHGHI